MTLDLIGDSAERLFSQHRPGLTSDADALWRAVDEAGYPLGLLTENEGGFGLSPAEALIPLRIAARHGAAVPLAETMAANWLLAHAGLPLADGPAALAGPSGARVPWGRSLCVLVTVRAEGDALRVTRIEAGRLPWRHGQNIAGEPRDDAGADLPPGNGATLAMDLDVPQALMAALRTQQLAGAMEAALALSVRYAGERVQFGRPIGKFQVIQQYLAAMADEVAAAGAAAGMAALALPQAAGDGRSFVLLAGAAKLRAGEAAGRVADLAHQIHGAIGFSQEYPLHPLTRRLWSWRDEDGAERLWAEKLGAALLERRDGGLWPQVTALQSEFF